MSPATLLTDKLKPVDAALDRLRQRSGNDPDLIAVLDGLADVVRELARQKWAA